MVNPSDKNRGHLIRTGLTVGNSSSDMCYLARNSYNALSWLWGDSFPDSDLKKCLCTSGEANWWKDFKGMTQTEACVMTKNNGDQEIVKKMGCR